MPDITRNMFYWFRGPSRRGDLASHRQLENNLTKSLIAVLDHCDRRVVLRAFLRRLGLTFSENVVFSLQRRPLLAGTTKKRVIVGITGGEAEVAPTQSEAKVGRPDAWICGANWTVLVESKIGTKIPAGELRGHARAAGWSEGSYQVAFLTWRELHRLAKGALAQVRKRDEVSRLLLGDWLAYLEYQNMTEFEKLEPIDFDFPGLPEEECRALLRHMRTRMRGFARLLAKTEPARKIARLYAESSVDQWKYGEPNAGGRGLWFNIGGSPSHREWHVTVYYRPDGLGATTQSSRNHLTRRLCRAGKDAMRRILDLAGKEAARGLCVQCRRAWYHNPASPYKGRNIVRADDPLVVMPSTLDSRSRDACASMLKAMLQRLLKGRKWRTELLVHREIPRAKLLRLPPEKQVALVARSLEPLYNVLRLLRAV